MVLPTVRFRVLAVQEARLRCQEAVLSYVRLMVDTEVSTLIQATVRPAVLLAVQVGITI